jgi:hypothetical protein
MSDQVKRPRGRPTIYTQELADKICERLAKGETLKSICRNAGMPDDRTVRIWALNNYQGFYPRYAISRQLGLDAMADQLLEIADDGSGDYISDGHGNKIPNNEHINRSRLRVDTRKWYLAKLAPKRYGEKVDLNVGGQAENPVATVIRWEK